MKFSEIKFTVSHSTQSYSKSLYRLVKDRIVEL